MRASTVPALATREPLDDWQLAPEVRLARLRAQIAVVRTLTDHVETFAQAVDAETLLEQIVEEMERLASRLSEAASSMASSRPSEVSAVFRCPPSASPAHAMVPSPDEDVDRMAK